MWLRGSKAVSVLANVRAFEVMFSRLAQAYLKARAA